jgi:hypothetical protein
LCGGAASLEIQDRSLPLHEGDLAVVGSTLYHRFECRSEPPVTLAVLFFQPDLIRADGGPDNAEYLTPFLLQDPQIPHLVPAKTSDVADTPSRDSLSRLQNSTRSNFRARASANIR